MCMTVPVMYRKKNIIIYRMVLMLNFKPEYYTNMMIRIIRLKYSLLKVPRAVIPIKTTLPNKQQLIIMPRKNNLIQLSTHMNIMIWGILLRQIAWNTFMAKENKRYEYETKILF